MQLVASVVAVMGRISGCLWERRCSVGGLQWVVVSVVVVVRRDVP